MKSVRNGLLALVVILTGGVAVAQADDVPTTCGSLYIVMRVSEGDCTDTLGLDGKMARTCFWQFGFRAPEAAEAFAALRALIPACEPGAEIETIANPVNHPDTHDQISFATPKGPVRLALKDKSGLQQTLLSLTFPR